MSREKLFYVYLVANRSRVLYVGFTSNLKIRVKQHREGTFNGFTGAYGCNRLVWFERYTTPGAAIAREKQIKRWRREKKVFLIERENPTWEDLSVVWDRPVELYRFSDGRRDEGGVEKRVSPLRSAPVEMTSFFVGVKGLSPSGFPSLRSGVRLSHLASWV